MNNASIDAIMRVMDEAFDPAYGEAWTRRQISDVLVRPGTFCLIGHADGLPDEAQGFALSRKVLDEEELLLIAVRPQYRQQGIGRRMLDELHRAASLRGTRRLFLEMRDGNPARSFYENFGFCQIGRRRDYYRTAAYGPIDALTFVFDIDSVE